MDLHANAALSWSGRRELARRVVDEGWTVRAAAEAAGVSVRYERSRPGELVHIDVKKLGRFHEAGKRAGFRPAGQGRPRRRDADGHDRGTTGWEYVHVAVDDYSRLAYAEVLTDEKAATAVAF